MQKSWPHTGWNCSWCSRSSLRCVSRSIPRCSCRLASMAAQAAARSSPAASASSSLAAAMAPASVPPTPAPPSSLLLALLPKPEPPALEPLSCWFQVRRWIWSSSPSRCLRSLRVGGWGVGKGSATRSHRMSVFGLVHLVRSPFVGTKCSHLTRRSSAMSFLSTHANCHPTESTPHTLQPPPHRRSSAMVFLQRSATSSSASSSGTTSSVRQPSTFLLQQAERGMGDMGFGNRAGAQQGRAWLG